MADETADEAEQGYAVGFRITRYPNSFYFDLGVGRGDEGTWDEISASMCDGAVPADDLMRAALALLCGQPRGDIYWEVEPGRVWVAFETFRGDRRGVWSRTTKELSMTGCRIYRNRVDDRNLIVEDEDNREVAVARSIVEVARSALGLGLSEAGDGPWSLPLITLRAALQPFEYF